MARQMLRAPVKQQNLTTMNSQLPHRDSEQHAWCHQELADFPFEWAKMLIEEKITTASLCRLWESLGGHSLALRLRDCMRDSDSSPSQPWGEADPKLPSGPSEAPDLARSIGMTAHNLPCLRSRVSRKCMTNHDCITCKLGPVYNTCSAGVAYYPGGHRLGGLLPEQGPQTGQQSRC